MLPTLSRTRTHHTPVRNVLVGVCSLRNSRLRNNRDRLLADLVWSGPPSHSGGGWWFVDLTSLAVFPLCCFRILFFFAAFTRLLSRGFCMYEIQNRSQSFSVHGLPKRCCNRHRIDQLYCCLGQRHAMLIPTNHNPCDNSGRLTSDN